MIYACHRKCYTINFTLFFFFFVSTSLTNDCTIAIKLQRLTGLLHALGNSIFQFHSIRRFGALILYNWERLVWISTVKNVFYSFYCGFISWFQPFGQCFRDSQQRFSKVMEKKKINYLKERLKSNTNWVFFWFFRFHHQKWSL